MATGNPAMGYKNGNPSTIGEQINTAYYWKKALVEASDEMYFSQMSSTENMPKHFGKTIKRFHYIPILDDRNVNDQGIDASGATIADGNLYGSSKDIGTISGKMPTLTEQGGRVNRVGMTRLVLEATLQKLGYFDEFTQESLDFDTDAELYGHMSHEMIRAANELNEAAIQMDLLNAAGVIRYAGDAVSDDTVTGEGTVSLVTYEDLSALATDLMNNRCPKQTKIISGSRMIDTATIGASFVLYIGTELLTTVKTMADPFGNAAFIPVQKYANAGTLLKGEIGSIDQFRIVCNPEMFHWAGVGAPETVANEGYRATNSKYDVFPMMVVGSEAFTTIGFQTDGKTTKFKIITRMPGEATADRNDPYGEVGFSSIKWYYATLINRPEWIGIIKTVAPL